MTRRARFGDVKAAGLRIVSRLRGQTDLCRCGHPMDDHLLHADFTTVIEGWEIPSGGLTTCPECDCTATWSLHEDTPPG